MTLFTPGRRTGPTRRYQSLTGIVFMRQVRNVSPVARISGGCILFRQASSANYREPDIALLGRKSTDSSDRAEVFGFSARRAEDEGI